MRYYSFANFMLSSIQQGIQPAHCIADTFIKYSDESRQRAVLLDWATNHKTMICLNGGNAAGIRDCYTSLVEFGDALQLPYCKFHEDEQSLDSTMTCCGIVVPEYLYDAAGVLRASGDAGLSDLTNAGIALNGAEYNFAVFLNQFGLAK
jgi:hypothetical protein